MREPWHVIMDNVNDKGIMAGSSHFADVWARDALYASWGLLHQDALSPVLLTLDTLMQHQSRTGQIPLRVGRKNMALSYFGVSGKQGPRYDTDKGGWPALDPNSLFIITVARLYKATSDARYIKRYRGACEKALSWLSMQDHDGDGLVEEHWYASWDDALRKEGASVYNNALYYAALVSMHELTGEKHFATRAVFTRKQLTEYLWNGQYFAAWEDRQVMDVAGNLLAIYFRAATPSQAHAILATLDHYKHDYQDVLPRTNYPAFDGKDVSTTLKLIGLGDYHNCGPYWLWIAALELLVRKEQGQDVSRLSRVIEHTVGRSGGYYELYEKPGRPLKRRIYRSERDFSWACGILELTKDRP